MESKKTPQYATGRKFLGVFPPKNTFDKAHLKAYLKGATQFRHGFETSIDGRREPLYYYVKQEYLFS